MTAIITDPELFYKYQARDIWADINPKLGEHIKLATAVREGLKLYNIAYPPPPPGWASTLGTVILVAACVAVVGAAVMGAGVSAAASAPAVTSSAATGVNAAAATATASGASVGASVTTTQAVAFAGKAASVVGPIAKGIGSATGNTTAEKLGTVADIATGDVKFTDGVVQLYKTQMKEKNIALTAEGEEQLRALAYAEQQQYAQYMREQAAQEQAKIDRATGEEFQLPKWVLPAAGIFAAVMLRG
jgi:hypothetical protein